MQDALPPLVSLQDLARFMAVKIRTVKRWKETGLLPEYGFECGGMKRWHREQIEGWIRSGGTPARPLPTKGDNQGITRDIQGKRGHGASS